MKYSKPFPLLLAVMVILATSCHQQRITPNLAIGMPEKDWHDTIKTMATRGELVWYDYGTPNSKSFSDSLNWHYRLKIADSIIPTNISVNDDGIMDGKLRLITFDFLSEEGTVKPNPNSTDPSYPSVKDDSIIVQETGLLANRKPQCHITWINSEVLSQQRYSLIMNYLTKLYGNPDSVLNSTGNRIDTINWTKRTGIGKANDIREIGLSDSELKMEYIDTSIIMSYFHSPSSIIVFTRSSFNPPIYYIPFWYLTKAELYEYSKSYDSELKAVRDSVLQSLTPKDLITIPLSFQEMQKDSYGLNTGYMILHQWLENRYRKTLAITQKIESLKGSIIINDKFGDLIYIVEDVKMDANGALPATNLPGLKIHNLGFNGGISFQERDFKIGINLNYKDVPERLREAVKSGEKLNFEFIPSEILFGDGSVLKD